MHDKYFVAIDPALNIDEDELIAVWQESTKAMESGRLNKKPSTLTMSPGLELAQLILVTANSIAASILTTLLTDLIKEKFYPKKKPTVTVREDAEGNKIIVVTEKSA